MFTLKIKTENTAFKYRNAEVARILRHFADELDSKGGAACSDLRDRDNNLVGRAQYHHSNQFINNNFIERGV